mgnify:CR=1 FL=1
MFANLIWAYYSSEHFEDRVCEKGVASALYVGTSENSPFYHLRSLKLSYTGRSLCRWML